MYGVFFLIFSFGLSIILLVAFVFLTEREKNFEARLLKERGMKLLPFF